jgi:hypothetical protein
MVADGAIDIVMLESGNNPAATRGCFLPATLAAPAGIRNPNCLSFRQILHNAFTQKSSTKKIRRFRNKARARVFSVK